MEDRRQHDRNHVLAAVTIAYGNHGATIVGVVRNLSGTGALILVDEPQRAPCDMDLTFARGGLRRRARVVWRGAAAVGIVFAPDTPPATSAPGATIVSLAEVRRARLQTGDAERLAARVARIARPPPRPRPAWIDLPSPDGERRRTTALVPPQTSV